MLIDFTVNDTLYTFKDGRVVVDDTHVEPLLKAFRTIAPKPIVKMVTQRPLRSSARVQLTLQLNPHETLRVNVDGKGRFSRTLGPKIYRYFIDVETESPNVWVAQMNVTVLPTTITFLTLNKKTGPLRRVVSNAFDGAFLLERTDLNSTLMWIVDECCVRNQKGSNVTLDQYERLCSTALGKDVKLNVRLDDGPPGWSGSYRINNFTYTLLVNEAPFCQLDPHDQAVLTSMFDILWRARLLCPYAEHIDRASLLVITEANLVGPLKAAFPKCQFILRGLT